MKEKVVWRLRTPGPLELVVEVCQVGDDLFYRRTFLGEVVVNKPIAPEPAGQLFFKLVSQGWHTE